MKAILPLSYAFVKDDKRLVISTLKHKNFKNNSEGKTILSDNWSSS